MFSGKRSGGNMVAAWVQGQLQVDGDSILGTRLIEMFGGEKPFAAAS